VGLVAEPVHSSYYRIRFVKATRQKPPKSGRCFNNVSFANAGTMSSTFLRRASKFVVRTDGPDWALHEYEIKFTFGVYPLQQ
jgi:hypothetical protein